MEIKLLCRKKTFLDEIRQRLLNQLTELNLIRKDTETLQPSNLALFYFRILLHSTLSGAEVRLEYFSEC